MIPGVELHAAADPGSRCSSRAAERGRSPDGRGRAGACGNEYHARGTGGMRPMIVLLLAFSIVAVTSAAALGQTIKIGASVALTGSLSREGRLLKEGYAFWLDHI